jgi:hypothetical protein
MQAAEVMKLLRVFGTRPVLIGGECATVDSREALSGDTPYWLCRG